MGCGLYKELVVHVVCGFNLFWHCSVRQGQGSKSNFENLTEECGFECNFVTLVWNALWLILDQYENYVWK